VLIDVAAAKGATMLPDPYRITAQGLKGALARQRVRLQPGDVVLIRGGRMTVWPDDDKYTLNQPGLSLDRTHWLVLDLVSRSLRTLSSRTSLLRWPPPGKAIRRRGAPETITIDGSEANAAVIRRYNEAHGAAIAMRQVRYLNNMVEQDHRTVKRLVRPRLGFKSHETAQRTIAGIELLHI
jgi:DDE domain/Putative cyclase